MKEEVSYLEEISTHDDDFTICISDDDDACSDQSNDWAGKLSQDQDFVVKKVLESTESKKRKATKQIDAKPLVPPKKTRRNSVSSHAVTSSKTEKKPNPIEMPSKQPSMMEKELNHLSVSNGGPTTSVAHPLNASDPPIVKHAELKFVDRLDPFARKPKKTGKPKTFDDALVPNIVDFKKMRIPKRTKFTSTTITNSRELLSILRNKNGTWPSDLSSYGKKSKAKTRVRFAEEHTVREFEPNDDEYGEIIIALPVKLIHERAAHVQQSISFENDPLHEIITDITEWNPEWLTQRNLTPPINGVNFIVFPLIDAYISFDNYKR